MNEVHQYIICCGVDAGFSHRYIARLAFGKATEKNIKRVKNFCFRSGFKVTDYRAGKSDKAKQIAVAILDRMKEKVRAA